MYWNRWSSCRSYKRNPGRCIVCDAPFCSCTPESIALKETKQQAAGEADKSIGDGTSAPPVATTFTTKEYKRKVRKPAARAG
jgi:hypothetical protein